MFAKVQELYETATITTDTKNKDIVTTYIGHPKNDDRPRLLQDVLPYKY